MDTLSENLHKELTTSDFAFKTITVKTRQEDFETHTHDKTLSLFADQLENINKGVRDLV